MCAVKGFAGVLLLCTRAVCGGMLGGRQARQSLGTLELHTCLYFLTCEQLVSGTLVHTSSGASATFCLCIYLESYYLFVLWHGQVLVMWLR